ncbi:SMP-30/gluconolactonase/LRE family protein [Microbulbifer bruguierae]|uniref:SMP-30/gluconolactonase/LRE family protein n=1 Tax=Microbulbifer bruguierae TaxID=3029061 RepID=A0ABY8NAW1_9GAMM|nr:SMP-30/gluconolactonase/LRE family protein [Microbulbifer bruguierae]WGL16065.1 SMP-30/gluconolactonase/LRE family protein [Microbulbifer bruguierae]
MLEVQRIDAIEVGNTLGEGVLWNSTEQSVWWTDIHECKLYRLTWPGRELEVFDTPERLCAFAFTDRENCIVAAFESGFALFDYRRGKILWQKTLLQKGSGLRFNDGKIDRQGRFWAGTMAEDGRDSAAGILYCLEPNGIVSEQEKNIHISNGCCWDVNSSHFYFADSPRRSIYRYKFDARRGDLSERELFARTMFGVYPDGATVDADGYLWSAQWRGARVQRYAPDGNLAGAIPVPVSQPTCVTFGGPDMNLMFVTTAKESLNEWTLDREWQAGNLFVFRTPFKGVMGFRFNTSQILQQEAVAELA